MFAMSKDRRCLSLSRAIVYVYTAARPCISVGFQHRNKEIDAEGTMIDTNKQLGTSLPSKDVWSEGEGFVTSLVAL